MLKATTLPVFLPGSPFGRGDSGQSPKVLMSTGILLSGETKGRNCDSGEAGEQLSEKTVPLLSGDRSFSSTLTPSRPRATTSRAAQLCPEFKLGVSP